MATTHCRTGSGLNSSSGGELKLYLKGKRNTVRVHDRSTGLPGITPKISKESTVQNALQTPFCRAASCTAAL